MTDEKKVLENPQGANPRENQGGDKGGDQSAEVDRLKKENENLENDLNQSREDVSKYQGEADRAKSKLDKDEELDVREEGLSEREHKANISDIERSYPDVFKSFPDAFDALKGSDKNEYINQAKYLRQGIDRHKQPVEKPAENAGDNNLPANDEAPIIPTSGQNSQSAHIFSRAEMIEHKGDQEWYKANEAEINKQLEKGLVK